MEKINLNEYLAANEYPGRGIAVAKAPDGRQMFICLLYTSPSPRDS